MVVGPLTFRRVTPDISGFAPRAVLRAVAAQILSDRQRWVLWLPVGFGTGIGLYFALPVEPTGVSTAVVAVTALNGLAAWLVAAAGLAFALTGVVGYCPACAMAGIGDGSQR